MKTRQTLSSIVLWLGLMAGAQTLGITVDLTSPGFEVTRAFIAPADNYTEETSVELTPSADKHSFSGEGITVNPDGVYYFFCQNDLQQASLPVYIADPSVPQIIKMKVGDYVLSTDATDPSNRALQAYTRFVADNGTMLTTGIGELSDESLRSMITSYIPVADSIIASAPLPEAVAQYLRISAYISASDAAGMTEYLASRSGRELPFSSHDLIPAPGDRLDNPVASWFPSAPRVVLGALPKGTLEERLAALDSAYTNVDIKAKAMDLLVSTFVDRFDYTGDFDDGERRLEAVTGRYGLPDNYIATFRARRATIPGAPFPEVTLTDRDGKAVDFAKFRGKYVYIDLWASWCGPCVREVPHLQALEHELKDKDVAFVSISTDSSTTPWIRKMDQLGMHGNQLIDRDGELSRKLNVRSIPHFLLYDPEGRLVTYKATRPSDPATAKLLKSLI